MAAGVYAPLTLTGVDGGRIDAVWTPSRSTRRTCVECTAVAELHAEEPCRHRRSTFRFNGEENARSTLR